MVRRGVSGVAASVRGCAIFSVGMTGRVTGGRVGAAGGAGGATGGAAGRTTTTGFSTTGAGATTGFSTGAATTGAGVGAGAATTTGAAGTGATTGGTTGFGGAATATTGCLGGAAATAGFTGAAACCSAWRRSANMRWISPGLRAAERSIFIGSAAAAAAREGARPPVRCLRTLSASSSSMELEWVFFSVTPTAVSASRISLLLTSSSRARSLIRTLLIRPRLTPLPSASCSWQLHSRRNQVQYIHYRSGV